MLFGNTYVDDSRAHAKWAQAVLAMCGEAASKPIMASQSALSAISKATFFVPVIQDLRSYHYAYLLVMRTPPDYDDSWLLLNIPIA